MTRRVVQDYRVVRRECHRLFTPLIRLLLFSESYQHVGTQAVCARFVGVEFEIFLDGVYRELIHMAGFVPPAKLDQGLSQQRV